MTYRVFDMLPKFGKTLVMAIGNKQRVVAEPLAAMLLGGNATLYNALKTMDLGNARAAAGAHVFLLYQGEYRA